MLVHQTFHHISFAIPALEASDRELDEALKSLSRLYLHFSGYFNPLNDRLDIEWYSLMVGRDALLVKHYKEMNSIWVKYRMFSKSPGALSHELMKSPGEGVVENAEDFYEHLGYMVT